MEQLDLVMDRLGEPAYAREGVLLYEGDSLILLDKLAGASIALTVTSPPYNIGKEYERPRPLSSYLDWCGTWIHQLQGATRSDGALWLNLGYISVPGRARAIPIPYLLWDRIPFYLLQEIVWNYGAGVAARKAFSPRNEKFLWYVMDPANYVFNLDAVRDPDVKYPNQKKNGKIKVNQLGKNPTDVWQIPKVTSGRDRSPPERTPHPAQFPVALVSRIIAACTHLGDVVLDPFMGSGSVAEAALRLGRLVVGIEIEPRYITLASRRIDRAIHDAGQKALFQARA